MTAFLAVTSDDAVARSPMERLAGAAGARFETLGGWNVAAGFGDDALEQQRMTETVGFADRSHLRKLEILGTPDSGPTGATLGGAALADDGAWWCPVTPTRTLVLGGAGPGPDNALDLTSAYCAMVLVGPAAGELLARFCALDVRPHVMPVGAFRPGSIARTPGYLLRSREDSLLLLVGWALGAYLWETVAQAAGGLGGGPVGAGALDA